MDRSCPHHATRKTGKTVVTTVTGVIGGSGSIRSFEPFGGSILSGAKKNDLPKKKGEEQGVLIKVTHFFGGDQIFAHVLGILRHFPFSCALFGWECNDC